MDVPEINSSLWIKIYNSLNLALFAQFYPVFIASMNLRDQLQGHIKENMEHTIILFLELIYHMIVSTHKPSCP